MKKIIKQLFCKILSVGSTNQILDKVMKYDNISFDIFDTVIKRDINNPSDLFEIIEKKFNINNFKEKRIYAEKIARKNSNCEEITLDEIYNNIELSKLNKEKAKELEIELEQNICTKNIEVFEIYKELTKKNKKIFFTSDMYLPIDVVRNILIKNGYTKFEGIYLSSKENLTKASGNLFIKLINNNNLEPKTIIHIGDSIKGDFLSPRKYGINSLLLNNKKKKYDSLDYNILSSFINNRIQDNLDYYQKFGYEVLGPILYSFTNWVHKEISKANIDKIYFLARDAKIIMDAYKILFDNNIPIHYIYLSRKLVIYTSFYKIQSFKELYKTCNSMIKDTSTIKDILSFLNIDYQQYKDNLMAMNIDDNNILMNLSNEKKEKMFDLIKKELQVKSREQENYLKEYLKQNQFFGKTALVDIGWNGTIQYYLSEIEKSVEINGYYYGVYYGKKDKYKSIKKHGFLFDYDNKNDYKNIIKLNVGLFEFMFLSTEGSTLYLKKENKTIKPVKGCQDLSDNNATHVLKMQNMAKKFVEDVANSTDRNILDNIDADIYFENYKNIIIKPTLKQIKQFKNFEFNNLSNNKLINNRSLFFYIFHPKKLYIDFRNCTCRVMFLKSLFKIKLPYYKILKKIYKISDF